MAPTVSVTFINSQSDDPVSQLTMPSTMTVREFLDVNRVDTNRVAVTIRLDGEVYDYDLDDELEDGMRVSVTPQNVKGA